MSDKMKNQLFLGIDARNAHSKHHLYQVFFLILLLFIECIC